jgi:hypothetical protein
MKIRAHRSYHCASGYWLLALTILIVFAVQRM